jgi:hypothetical protein
MNKKQWIAAAEAYAGTFVASALTIYMMGDRNVKDLALAGLASIAAPLIKGINPNDKTYGLIGTAATQALEDAQSPAAKKAKKAAAQPK